VIRFWLGTCLFSFSLGATTFQLQDVKQQLKAADGVMMGNFLKSKGVVLENGSIATQMIFKMNREYGLQSDLFGMDEVIVHYPGGRVGDRFTQVDGVPQFVSGEKVALMIKNVNNRYWGLNLGMGTYKVINYGKEVMLINSLFPDNPQIGQIRLDEFEKSIKFIKGTGLKTVYMNDYPSEVDKDQRRMPASLVEEGKKRSIASKSEQVENEGADVGLQTYWLIGVLAFLGGLFRFMRQKTVR
jgi:hypothetical protein